MEQLYQPLIQFLGRFVQADRKRESLSSLSPELQQTLDDYSGFMTDIHNQRLWDELKAGEVEELHALAVQLRDISARSVSTMEKIRAYKLLNGGNEGHDYFRNIEASIEKEFGSFTVSANSKVLLIGSGAFPMTPLLIAQRTGAEVVGIDIDPEAVELGKKVVERLGPKLPIQLENLSLERLQNIGEMTHIIISSTVSVKYELLDQMHSAACPDVVVAMRFGNGLKSLFNYPMEEVDNRKWRLAESIVRADHVFDVALYRKAGTPHQAGRD
ncbi:class I SAM-dependent methyltransferase [Paenibacillus sp. GCM10027627]|uniref:class I SAM-dependent methyltransferase n=1 Tax=unclassified Paenibacillus TaxID=185978 RepID=UPI00362B30A2